MIYKVLKKIKSEGGIEYYDPLSIDFSTFKWKNGYTRHTVNKIEADKPFLISKLYYGTYEYEYEILFLNNIYYSFDELEVGDTLNIPDKTELEMWIKDNIK